MPRVRRKTEVATVKLMPRAMRGREAAAKSKHRSMTHVFEVAVVGHAKRRHIVRPVVLAAHATGPTASNSKAEQPREQD
jgi:hypothetical protein